jgi:hypothetical protein
MGGQRRIFDSKEAVATEPSPYSCSVEGACLCIGPAKRRSRWLYRIVDVHRSSIRRPESLCALLREYVSSRSTESVRPTSSVRRVLVGLVLNEKSCTKERQDDSFAVWLMTLS